MKRLIIAVVIVLAIVGGIVAAIPVVLSTALVKQRIADQIADWTGRKVTFTGNPRVSAIPYLRMSISDVTIGDPTGAESFIAMSRLTANLRILPLLFGRVEIAEFGLRQPKIHFRRDDAGHRNWDLIQVPRERRKPGPTTLLRLSKITITDGAIVYDDAATGRHEDVTAATLSLAWPGADDPMVGDGTFAWRGETVEFNGSIGDPIALNEGRASPARFAIASTPIRASFSGNVSRFADLQIEGPTTLSTPSLRRLIGWLGTPIAAGSTLGAASIAGNLNWTKPSVSLTGANVELDGNTAEGTLSVGLSDPRPTIAGTLASSKIDLSPYVEAFRAELNAAPWATAPIRMPVLTVADVDLRLSTEQVLVGAARLGNVAIAAGIKQGKLAVEIGDAQIYSGSLAATVTAEMRGTVFAGGVEARMSGVPAGVALADIAGIKSVDGTGAATIKLDGSGETWGEFAHKLAGAAKVTLAEGTMAGLDVSRIAALLGQEMPSSASNGATAFSTAICNLTIAGGAIRTEDLRAEGDSFSIDLAGEASLFDSTVNGRGMLTLGKPGTEAVATTSLPFELGGTWQEPELFPDLGRIINRSEVAPVAPRG